MLNYEPALYINGRVCTGHSNNAVDNINPASNQSEGQVVWANEDDVNQAVKTSKQAFNEWSRFSSLDRARVLNKTAALLREHKEQLALLEVQDCGKPISEALSFDIDSAAQTLEYFAAIAASIEGATVPAEGALAYTRPEPLGVCAAIGAWNYPLQIACWKSAPALVCGNSVIFKPSEHTPTTAFVLAQLFSQAGLPDGVFNVVQGGAEVGNCLATHSDVAKVALTGSVATGKKILQAAAQTLKPVSLELGGKSPLIIFADADLQEAVKGAMMANFYTQGEICSNGTRVFVEKRILPEFLMEMEKQLSSIKIGSPLDHDTNIGALISAGHLKKVKTHIERACEAGATCWQGGEQVFPEGADNGNFMEPTILTDCRDEMEVVLQEVFGPVMSVLTFESEQEVIQRANNTEFGLAAGVFTRDIKQAHRVAHQLDAGTCWINNYNITPYGLPFGGFKQSGLGFENARMTVQAYMRTKSVYVELQQVESAF